LRTLTESGRRYKFTHKVAPVDLGLRLADVNRLGLESEGVAVDTDRGKLARRLRINGADGDEIEFLLSGRRVELNSMASDRFVRFVEDKLRENGVTKVVPPPETLAKTFSAIRLGGEAARALEAELARLNAEPVATPADLEQRVRAILHDLPHLSWDAAIKALVGRSAP